LPVHVGPTRVDDSMGDECSVAIDTVTDVEVENGFDGCEYVEAVLPRIHGAIESGNECYRGC
jgi:hypothetical protein